jgi:hypothetical protein
MGEAAIYHYGRDRRMLEELNRPAAAQHAPMFDPKATGRIVEKKNDRAAAGPFVKKTAGLR